MGPVASIELLLDGASEAAVRAEWAALAEAGLSSLAGHTAPSNRPHLTLVVREAEALLPFALPGSVAGALPLPIVLGAPMLFGAGDRRVLVRSVVPSAALLALHAELHAAAGRGDDAPHTRPGGWTPHVTLARRIRVADLPVALALVGGELSGEGVALRHWNAATATVTPLG